MLSIVPEQPIVLGEGYKPAWAKEGEDAWVLRLLDIPEGCDATLTCLNEASVAVTLYGRERYSKINQTRRIALGAWMRNVLEKRPENGKVGCGVAVMLRTPVHVELICQQKDDLHPNPDCRLRYCLFGGSSHFGETPEETALRELYEEIRDIELADELAARLIVKGIRTLPSVQWEGEYDAGFSVVLTDDPDEFASWAKRLLAPDVFSESNPAHLVDSALFVKIMQERGRPGRWFVGSHDRLISEVLGL